MRAVGQVHAYTLSGRCLKRGELSRYFIIGVRTHPIQSSGKKSQPGSDARRISDHLAECPGTFGTLPHRADYLMNQNTLKNETNPINVPLMILGILLIPFLNLLFFFRRAFSSQIAIYYLVLHVCFSLRSTYNMNKDRGYYTKFCIFLQINFLIYLFILFINNIYLINIVL